MSDSDTPEEELYAEWKTSLSLRLAINMVCRAWRDAGRHLIFEHIILEDIPRLLGVLRALDVDARSNKPYGFARVIKTIRIGSVIPNSWMKVYREALGKLLDRCPNLHIFSDRTVSTANSSTLQPPSVTPHFGGQLRLTELEVSGDYAIDISVIRQVAPTLTSLTIKPYISHQVAMKTPSLSTCLV